jgi:hypothetical protein
MALSDIKATLTAAGNTAVDDAYALGQSEGGGSGNAFAENTWGVVRNDRLLDNISTGVPLVFTGSNAQALATQRANYMASQGYAGAAAKELTFV